MSGVRLTLRERRRRRKLVLLSLGAGGVAALAVAVPVVGGVLAPALTPDQRAWRSVGRVEDFTVGRTVEVRFAVAARRQGDGPSSTVGAWLRRVDRTRFVCFQMNCTHLGCPVRWVESSGLFLCPCHGGVYDMSGRNVAGPPRIPLRRHHVRVVQGVVQVQAQPIPLPSLTGAP